jgi:hypothetical protein
MYFLYFLYFVFVFLLFLSYASLLINDCCVPACLLCWVESCPVLSPFLRGHYPGPTGASWALPTFPNGENHADSADQAGKLASRKAQTAKIKVTPYLLSPAITNLTSWYSHLSGGVPTELPIQDCATEWELSIADRPLHQRLHIFSQRRRPSLPKGSITWLGFFKMFLVSGSSTSELRFFLKKIWNRRYQVHT